MTLEQLLKLVEERVLNRFYGKFPGVVRDVEDPLGVGRLRACVPAVLGEDTLTGWALPCAPFGGGKDRGLLCMPEVGDTVWIEFAGGDLSQPIWAGAFWGAPDSGGQQDDLAEEAGAEVPTSEEEGAGPGLHVLRTRAGHRISLKDEGDIVVAHGEGKEELRLTQNGSVVVKTERAEDPAAGEGEVVMKTEKVELRLKEDHALLAKTEKAELQLSQDGEVVVRTEKVELRLAANGEVTLSAEGDVKVEGRNITVDGQAIKLGASASEALVLGNTFMSFFNTHTHPTGVGPSGPPMSPMSPSHLSQKSKTE
ncbi:MAG: hypothetical protein JXB05_02470 [Myxococcaceae bacterium]|nr:hypothetical protein [Myxococcaceae bacterium]